MFTELIESVAKRLVVESIRDESLGDLWEANYNLRQKGTSRFLRTAIFVWNFILLIKASILLISEKIVSSALDNLDSSLLDDEEQHVELSNGTDLTLETIVQIRRYCSIRQLYAPILSKKLMSHFKIEDSYWTRQTDRILEKCQSRGERLIDSETIVNSFILSNLIRKIEAIPPGKVDIAFLHDLVEDVCLTDKFINRYVEFYDKDYNRQLIFRTWSLAVYVISWKPGQDSWMHHHGYALDAIKVIRGKMTHWLVSPDEFDGYVPFEDFKDKKKKKYEGPSETFLEGNIVLIDRCQGHQIANLSDKELVTLHFRFGHPPEDDHWRSTNDTEMFVWNQTEGCFDLIGAT
jgi:hypothetical protein